MKVFSTILSALSAGCIALVLFTSCHIYKDYERPDSIKAPDSFRTDYSITTDKNIPDSISSEIDDKLTQFEAHLSDTNSIRKWSWKELFADTNLQNLINIALEENFDLQNTFWRIKEYEARLGAARMAFTPSLSLGPNGGISSQYASGSLAFGIPASASWEIDLFGKLLNAKRVALANLAQTYAYKQEIQTRLIASVATSYYTLVMLDRQLEISEETSANWELTVSTMEALKTSGQTNEAAVNQSRSGAYSVKAEIISLKQQIKEQENALCLLLGQNAQEIKRSDFNEILSEYPDGVVSIGLPMQLLSNRPDVQEAEAALRSAFAATNVARASFYPQLTLSANGAWTNLVGAIVNPAQLIWSAAAALTAPIFNRGQLRANLKIAKAQQEESEIYFKKTLLQACNEVSDAYSRFSSSTETIKYRHAQVICMKNAVEYTKAMLMFGKSTYLEVITAQQELLRVQLQEINNLYNRASHMIELYRSLGGGAQDISLQELSAQYDETHKNEAKRRKKAEARMLKKAQRQK